MSGLDEQNDISYCLICKDKVVMWSLKNNYQDLGCFNLSKHLLKNFGVLNSSKRKGLSIDDFLILVNAVQGGECMHRIDNKKFIKEIKKELKERLKNERA
jgi:hypothetical protein